MNKLTLREKIGQLIVTGFPKAEVSAEFERLVAEYKIGNAILFSYNAENVPQLKRLCGELRALIERHTGMPAFIAIDQEGGRVTRLPADATNVPGAMAVASTGRPEHAYAAGRLTARELRALGINFNLAPVLDINNNKRNPVINVRSYGDTAEAVETYGLPMMKGLRDEGVLSAIKHFPGHGDTNVDSHLGLPVIGKTAEQLEELELRPFERAINAGAESVMTAHILFPQLEPERVPATMSRAIVTGLLKGKLGYGGLIVSDCLEMDAVKTHYGTAEGALGALKAGVHLLFISHTPQLVREAAERIERAVLEGELSEEALDEAVEKVLYYKEKYRILPSLGGDAGIVGCAAHRRTAEAISEESICLTSGRLEPIARGAADTMIVGCYPFRTDRASNAVSGALSFPRAMAEALGVPYRMTDMNPDDAEIEDVLAETARYSRIVLGLYNGQDHPGQLKLARALVAAGRRVTAAALGKPYDLELIEGVACGLAAFEYTPLSLRSLAKMLCGEAVPTGRLRLRGMETSPNGPEFVNNKVSGKANAPLRYVAGWDGGGTKTAVVVVDETGKEAGSFASGSINLNGRDEAGVRESIRELLASTSALCGGLEACEYICVGAAGVSNPSVVSRLTAMIRECGYEGGLAITGDHETAMAGALESTEGMILIAGTGSICYGRNAQGDSHRTGGGGHLVDDEGSGYSIGRELIAAALRASDGRIANRTIAPAVLARLGLGSVRELIGYVYDPRTNKKDIAALATLLSELCDAGDGTALAIAERSARALFELVVPVAERLSLQDGRLALAGGVLLRNGIIRDSLTAMLLRKYPDLQCVPAKRDAARGAALMALRQLQGQGCR
ncbi:glycoside hydrolase family 3 N-terminal domain-containing protein [Paenibacillus thailandensis]|uniref:Glycoside hydrolase family 3 N-terminal domain-containing protein n=1 Tax=Paenibacillus thailandensis TaxID=393250 RepID=A0ABW5R3N8_9BACL